MGFLKGLGKFLNAAGYGATRMMRNSDNPEIVMRYLDAFDNMCKSTDLEALQKLLSECAYAVKLDSSNDYIRRNKLEERIAQLRRVREEDVSRKRSEFDWWLGSADIDALESGLSRGKYQIQYDSQNDASRKAALEKKLRPLQEKRREEQRKKDCVRMEQLFRDYLAKMETELYRSYYVFCDFKMELSHLTAFQKAALDGMYAKQIQELLSQPAEKLKETISNCIWQVNRKKTVAGKSLMLLILAERLAEADKKVIIGEALASLEEAVLCNAYSGYIEEADRDLPADELLRKGNKAKVAGRPQKAAAYYLAAANGGNAEAMARLGLSFLYGLGVPENNNKAFFWLTKAAEQRSPEGLYGLGVCYYWGYGVARDIVHALALYKESFSLGCAAGAWPIGGYYEKAGDAQDLETAFNWNFKAAAGGCLSGMLGAYTAYRDGIGVEASAEIATEWLNKLIEAANQADSALDITAHKAYNDLGRAFYNGWSGTGGKDEAKALEWFKKGTAIGYRTSKTWLIDFNEYESRNRILKDLEAENYEWALNKLAGFYDSGKGIEADKVLSNFYYLKAAKYGNSNAQYNIGMAYLEGRPGVRQDEDEAIFWLEKAAAQGVEGAKSEVNAYQERHLQARLDSVRKKKTALGNQIVDLTEQLKKIEARIDGAASEKEEAAAIADQEEVQAKRNKLQTQIDEVDAEISALKDEAERYGYSLK